MKLDRLVEELGWADSPELRDVLETEWKSSQDTALQRALLDRLAAGQHDDTRAGACFLFPDDLDWGQQVYLRQEFPGMDSDTISVLGCHICTWRGDVRSGRRSRECTNELGKTTTATQKQREYQRIREDNSSNGEAESVPTNWTRQQRQQQSRESANELGKTTTAKQDE